MLRGPVVSSSLIVAIAVVMRGAAAAAQPTSAAAAAEALFQEGRALLMAGKPDEACPKLAESQRLDPASGTLLALALCHEQQGKLASAWAEFADVEARSRLDGRADRERTAREHGTALRPRLSTLTSEVPAAGADAPALVITLDGVAIGRAAWGSAIPVDGGERLVEATVPDRPPWKTTVSIARERDQARVVVRVPEPPPPARPVPAVEAPAAGPRPNAAAPAGAWRARRTIALALFAAGGVGLGAAAFLALDARSDYRTAVGPCTDGVCPPEAYDRAQDARHAGNVATAIGAAGITAALAGLTLWLWPTDGAHGAASGEGGRRLVVLPGGLCFSGSF
jgi:hypothetical protein